VKHTLQPGTDYGIEGSKQSVLMLRVVFPDIVYNIEDLIAEDDKVVARWTAQVTHKGEFMGIPPTNK
jgi:predicted ester cyclase